jgi:hypothetical protein
LPEVVRYVPRAPQAVLDGARTPSLLSAMTGDASKRKIRDWVDRGEFNSYALVGKTVYSEPEVVDFLERVKARGPSRAPWRGTNSSLARTPQQRPEARRPSKAALFEGS